MVETINGVLHIGPDATGEEVNTAMQAQNTTCLPVKDPNELQTYAGDKIEIIGGDLVMYNEGGYCSASVEVKELVAWLRKNHPELVE